MWMVPRDFLRSAVRRDRCLNGWKVRFRQADFHEPLLQCRLNSQPPRSIRSVPIAQPIVCAREIVKEHGCP
jgi:hypothetical protein